MYGTHRLLFPANVNLLDGNTSATERNTEALLDWSKDVGLKVNTDKSKYVLVSRHQKGECYRSNEDCYGVLKNMAKIKQFGGRVRHKNHVYD